VRITATDAVSADNVLLTIVATDGSGALLV
jgi:hypothetical protein